MKLGEKTKKVLLSLYHYLCFFLLMAFIITCCMMLFLSTMSKSMGITLNEENIRTAAVITFVNVVFLSLVFTVIDALRRRVTVERPVKMIVSAAERIAKGDYSVRIPPLKSLNRADGLDRIIDCYNRMAEELSGVEGLHSDFIANVSHELKTPIAVMQNYARLLQTPDISEGDRVKYTRAISESAERLSELVGNILKLSKLENQSIYNPTAEYDLSEQITLCLLDFEAVWERKNITINADIEEGIMLKGDPELLSLVWNNLFSNALKFTESGGTVSVSLSELPEGIGFSVTDTGCGISPEVGRRIFDKFYQGDTSHKGEGNGLGLALVRRVVSIVGGDISVSSEMGKGSTFKVLLKNEKDNK